MVDLFSLHGHSSFSPTYKINRMIGFPGRTSWSNGGDWIFAVRFSRMILASSACRQHGNRPCMTISVLLVISLEPAGAYYLCLPVPSNSVTLRARRSLDGHGLPTDTPFCTKSSTNFTLLKLDCCCAEAEISLASVPRHLPLGVCAAPASACTGLL
jgi:hypothetical protein